jgi:hypothetical protein
MYYYRVGTVLSQFDRPSSSCESAEAGEVKLNSRYKAVLYNKKRLYAPNIVWQPKLIACPAYPENILTPTSNSDVTLS